MPPQKTSWNDADLAKQSGHQPFMGLNRGGADEYGPVTPDPAAEAYARGDDLRPADGASIDDMLADAKAALASYGELKDLTDYQGAPENQPRGTIRATSPYESLYWRAKDAIRPEIRDMVSSLAPMAVTAGGPLGLGAGVLTAASEAGQAAAPNASMLDRGLHGLFAALAMPGGAKALAYGAGKPSAKETAYAAGRKATQDSVESARAHKAAGHSYSQSGKLGGVPSGGKSSAKTVNMSEHGSDVGRPPLNVKRPQAPAPPAAPPVSKAGASVPVHKDLRNMPESIYEQDLGKLGGRQGVQFEERAATDRRATGDVGEDAYQVLLKYLGGKGGDVPAAGSAANTAARAEQAAGVAGGSRPLGTPRQGPRRGTGINTETATPAGPRTIGKGKQQSDEESFIDQLLNGIRNAVGRG